MKRLFVAIGVIPLFLAVCVLAVETRFTSAHLWNTPFSLLYFWKTKIEDKTSFRLTELMPFAWERVCSIDDSYYEEEEEKELEELINLPSLNVKKLPYGNGMDGGYLIFIHGNRYTLIEADMLDIFLGGAAFSNHCWKRNVQVVKITSKNKTSYQLK